jgi:hypothetical protein
VDECKPLSAGSILDVTSDDAGAAITATRAALLGAAPSPAAAATTALDKSKANAANTAAIVKVRRCGWPYQTHGESAWT